MRLHRIVTATLATLLAVGLTDAGAVAAGRAPAAPPVLTLSSRWGPSLPQSAPYVVFTVTATATTDVTLTASADDGLTVSPSTTTLADVTPTDDDGRVSQFDVRATAPGFHTLTVTATAPGADPVTVTLPRIAPRGLRLTSHDSQAGGLYAYQGYEQDTSPDGTVMDFRSTAFLNFFNGRRVTHQPALDAKVACPEDPNALNTCDPYRHDDTTGLTAIDGESIGLFTGRRSYLDDGSGGHLFQRLVYPTPGQRVGGAWGYTDSSYSGTYGEEGLWSEHLTLTKQGRFTLSYRYYGDTTSWRGTYTIGRSGRLALRHGRKGHRHTTVETLVLGATPSGKAAAGTRGAYLDVREPDPKAVEYGGNLMAPIANQ